MPIPRRSRARRGDPEPDEDPTIVDTPTTTAAPRGAARERPRRPVFELDFDVDPAEPVRPPRRRGGPSRGEGPPGGRHARGAGAATEGAIRVGRGAETAAGRAAARRRRAAAAAAADGVTSGATPTPTSGSGRGAESTGDRVDGEIEALEDYESATRSAAHTTRRDGGDLGRRILIALPLIVAAILLISAGGPIFVAGFTAIGALCAWELSRLLQRGRASPWAAMLGVIVVGAATGLGGTTALLGALALALPLVFLAALVRDPPGGAPGLATTLLAVSWIGLCVAHAILLRDLEHGAGILVSVLVGTFVGDTGAYLGGRVLGRRPLAPRISPNKTWEGLVAGWVIGVAAVWFAGLYQDWLGGVEALLLGLAVATVAPIGDLFESYVKRDAGAKDTSGLLGPHGGALDRVDAAMFAIVAGHYVWLAMGAGAA